MKEVTQVVIQICYEIFLIRYLKRHKVLIFDSIVTTCPLQNIVGKTSFSKPYYIYRYMNYINNKISFEEGRSGTD